MGPFLPSRKGNKYLFVVVDELSKWTELFPMRVATAKKVVEVLEDQIFCRYGAPRAIVSDNGKQFVSKAVKSMCKQWNVTQKLCSPYHPHQNLSERTNRNIKKMISAYVEDSHHTWDLHLQKFALALRTSINEATKVTPSLLNLGRQLPLPFDRAMQQTDIFLDPEKYKDLPETLLNIINWVRENIITAHKKQAIYYDPKHRQSTFKTGDWVLIKNHTLSDKDQGIMKKLTPRWIGPYRLGKSITSVTFELLLIDSDKCIGKRHVCEMKPYYKRTERITDHNTNTQKSIYNLRKKPRVNYRTLHNYY